MIPLKKNKLDFLTVFPHVDFPSSLRFYYHLGVGYIHSYLAEKGIHSHSYISSSPLRLTEAVEEILSFSPRIVGFTCYDVNYYIIKLISRELKRRNKKILIAIGGPTATFSDTVIIKDNPAIDICVRGEGELTVYEMIQCLEAGRSLNGVRGITFKEKGQIIRNEDRPLIEHLDNMPSPYLSGMIPPEEGGELGILTSRGCAHRCVYCLFAAMSRWSVRVYSVDRIMAELKAIAEKNGSLNLQNKKLIKIYDDSFSTNPRRVKEICRHLIEENLSQYFDFWCETRADSVNRELLELLYQAGFKEISFGMESGSPEVLRNIKKVRHHFPDETDLEPEKRFLQKVIENVAIAKEIGLWVDLSIILGLPGETPEQGKATIDMIKKANPDAYYHNSLVVHPGTELFSTYKEYGLKVNNILQYGGLYRTTHTYDTRGIKSLDTAFLASDIKSVGGMVSGTAKIDRSLSPLAVCIRDDALHLADEIFQWLKQLVNLKTRVYLQGADYDESVYVAFRKVLVSHELPLFTLFFLRERDCRDELTFGFNTYPVFYDMVFTGFAGMKPQIEAKERQCVVLTLDTAKDTERFICGSQPVEESGTYVLDGGFMEGTVVVQDACRWSCGDCPAQALSKLNIDAHGSIRPCTHGQVVTKVGGDFHAAREKIDRMWQDEKVKRGCADCPVQDSCSKCLFPHPMSTEEYCTTRKKFRHTDEVLRLLDIIRETPFPEPGERENITLYIYPETAGSTPCLFKNSLKEISIGSACYLYDGDTRKARPVSRTLLEMVVALKRGKPQMTVTREMAEKYKVPLEDMKKGLQTVIDMCAKFGYLSPQDTSNH